MQGSLVNQISEIKRLIKWIGQNPTKWEAVCGVDGNEAAYFDHIETIKELQQNEFYPQILNLVFNPHNGIQYIAQQAILEEITETWGKEQWDEVIDRLIIGLSKAHQAAKAHRAETYKGD